MSKTRVYRWGRIRKEHEALRLKTLQQALFSAKEVKLKDKASFFIEEFHQHSLNLIHAGRWQSTFRRIPKYFFELLAVVGLAAAIVYMVFNGKELAHIAPVIAFICSCFYQDNAFRQCNFNGIAFLRYIDETITLVHQELSQDVAYALDQKVTISKPIESISFDHISFAYTGQFSHSKGHYVQIFAWGIVGIIGPAVLGRARLLIFFLAF